ncbi:Outer membrane receptor proteins, mostly Fe transport [Reichenbachiella faecimaris]|uniref:Outer membrane receptor proteins, mostly Fe transport n=1 Tax=Reichenbachiella faecimaris TaxID=692418 RepID=A0A1W2GEG0_REIFA|nr:TonB-dependent receptor [Reichenbachiella faecimaris]SMD34882.1 Outer membrane receptor proteins, mostly Fe transport [Reichenbachiella faecimaris]
MNKLLLAKLLVCFTFFAQAQNTISGYVKDASNGETLIGATVLIKGSSQGVITNVYGFYSITLPANTYEVEYRYIGYQPTAQQVDLSESRRIDIELLSDSQQLEEVVISAEPEDVNVSGMQMSTNKLDIETITKIPSFMGEADVLRSIQMVPGVATVGEGASGFNVRGGSVGQNMVLLDEAPVYNSSHLMGFFSVFNPDAVKDVNLIKGGIPARYGGRISSVLDIRMKEGNVKEFQGQGGVGTVFSRLSLEAPIVKDKASFILAGRRSYIDVLAKPFTDVFDGGAALNFYDLTAKTNWNINSKNRVFLSGYFGRDVFKFDKQQGFNWGNSTATLRWNHIFNDKLFANFTAFYSDYDYELAFGEDEMDKFRWSSRILNYDFKPEFTYFMNPNNEISFGGEALFFKFEPANVNTVNVGEAADNSLPSKNALETALYISNNQKIGTDIELQYGVRFSNFNLLGSGMAYTYGDTIPGERRPLLDSTSYDSREVMESYHNLEPRLAIKYQFNKNNSFKASYNKTSQYIHLVSNTTASNPLDVWNPSSNNIEPQIGHQVALGWFRNFGPDNNVEFSAEVYYRKTKNQIDYIDGAELLINEYIEGDLLSGDGRAYGLELYAKKNTGRLTGWVSYTLARTELKVDGINNGNWYPTRYDQAHNFKTAVFYDLNKNWQFSANFTFLTGTPTTFPTSRFEQAGYVIPYAHGDGRNNFRIPSYHRFDLSATKYNKTVRKNGKPKRFHSHWVFAVYNVLGTKNPFSIYFTQADERFAQGQPVDTQARQVSIIGSMIPSVSYNFKF